MAFVPKKFENKSAIFHKLYAFMFVSFFIHTD